jgi:hypothetical protein
MSAIVVSALGWLQRSNGPALESRQVGQIRTERLLAGKASYPGSGCVFDRHQASYVLVNS